jgi:hypothetical protein
MGKALELTFSVAGKLNELADATMAGVTDVTGFAGENIKSVLVRGLAVAKLGVIDLSDTAYVLQDIAKLSAADRVKGVLDKSTGFLGRIAGVARGINQVLEDNRFTKLEGMEKLANRLETTSRELAGKAAGKALGIREDIEALRQMHVEDVTNITLETAIAKKQAERANKFPNFVSRFKKLFNVSN